MNKTFFISDTHFGENNIFLSSGEKGKFTDCEEKDKTIFQNWNNVVGKEDTVYVLGDFGVPEVAGALNGKKILIKGNHDLYDEGSYILYFDKVYDVPILYKDFYILSHKPKYVSMNAPYANIFGHVHNNPIYRDFSERHYCVCANRIKYTPIEDNIMLRRMRSKIIN